jgi:hypothetical protein
LVPFKSLEWAYHNDNFCLVKCGKSFKYYALPITRPGDHYRVLPLSQAAYKLPLPVIELEVQPETLTRLRLDVLKSFRQLLDSQ